MVDPRMVDPRGVGERTPGLVLGIDTSVDVRVGLSRDGEPVARAGLADSRAHAEQLMPLLDGLLVTAGVGWSDLDAIAVGLGPGPFTGLRVGIATARTLSFALRVPWHGVCGLDVIALEHRDHRRAAAPAGRDQPRQGQPVQGQPVQDQPVQDQPVQDQFVQDQFVAAVDARRHEVYWARYDQAGRRLEGPHVGRAAELPSLPVAGPVEVLGSSGRVGPQVVDAALLAARVFAAVGTEPLYLRQPDAQEPGPRKSALPRLLPRVRP